jgi:hypothetical protein
MAATWKSIPEYLGIHRSSAGTIVGLPMLTTGWQQIKSQQIVKHQAYFRQSLSCCGQEAKENSCVTTKAGIHTALYDKLMLFYIVLMSVVSSN